MEISIPMSDIAASDVYRTIVEKFDNLSKAYVSPYVKYGPTQPVGSSTPVVPTSSKMADPAFDRGWNVLHEAPHGTYRTTGPMGAKPVVGVGTGLNSNKSIEVLYAPKRTGVFQSLGFFGDKGLAEQARLEHHDRAAAGMLKNELVPQLHSTVEGFMSGLKMIPKGSPERGRLITSHMSHPPFQAALKVHPQGGQINQMLNSYLNSPANAGFKPGQAKTMVKSNFEMSDMNKDESWHADAEKRYGKHGFQEKYPDLRPHHHGEYCKVCGMSAAYRLHTKSGKDEYKKSEYTPSEVFEAIRKSIVERVKDGMTQLQKAENEGSEKLSKGIGSLPSKTPSEKELHSNYLNKKAVLPHVGKEVSAEGSGGQVEKGKKLGKAALPMTMPKAPALKPAGVPGAKAGDAPKPPTTPKAPGAGVAKTQIETEGVNSNEQFMSKNTGGMVGTSNPPPTQMAMNELQKKAPPGFSEETMHKLKSKYGTESAFKIAWSAHNKKGDTKKMELPHTSNKASGGQMSHDEVMKYADEYMKKMDLPTSATIPTGIKVTGNPEGVQHGEAHSCGSSGDHQYIPSESGSAPSPKNPSGLPTTSALAIGGQTKTATVPSGPDVKGRPGATQTPDTKKMELPQTNQKANGGNVKSSSIPAGPTVKGTPGAVQKMELPQTSEKADGGQKSSAKVPAGPTVKGRPGAVQKTEGLIAEMQKDESSSEETPLTEESSAAEVHAKMNKGYSVGGADLNKALHPSPVFNVLRQGGASGMKQAMMSDPKSGPSAISTAPAPVKPMPTPAAHAQRASQFSDFMPQGKFGKGEITKSELDTVENLIKAQVIARQPSN